jgi:ribosomal protein S18 acetylase RimI-like enzyme
MSTSPLVRQLTPADLASLAFLTNNAEYVHRHLDWRSPIDWVGSHPFLGIERQNRLLSVLACPYIQASVGWIRLFAFLNWNSPQLRESWDLLFHQLVETNVYPKGYVLAGLGLQSWFAELLVGSGFSLRQNIVVLQWLDQIPQPRPFPGEVKIRPMQAKDLDQVLLVDNLSFDYLWQHTQEELALAFQQACYATVAEMNGEIVGYQISTGTKFHSHLARLAVDPGLQRLSIGYGLVRELLCHFKEAGISNITVNTQSDNYNSLGLYQKTGFYRTGDEFPVYTFALD